MALEKQVESLISLHNLAVADGRKYGKRRFAYWQLERALSSRAYIGLAGLRGSGKTVLLRQLAAEKPSSFYISMDSIGGETKLFELARELSQNYGKKLLLIDEIHFCPNWQAELKKAYDFLDVKIAFTSSSSVEIMQSKHDLSRRVLIIPILPFSFREYIYFRKGVLEKALSLDAIAADPKKHYGRLMQYEPDFLEFCTRGALPACLGTPEPQVLRNIVEKIVNKDLLAVGRLDNADLQSISAILRFMSRAGVEVCSYSSVAKNTGTTKYKAQYYLSLLEKAFVVKIVPPYGTNITKEPKILYALPFRQHFADGAGNERLAGALREEFFIHHVSGAGLQANYLKGARGEKLADYLVFEGSKKFIFEIGGSGKTGAQLKGAPKGARFVLNQPGNLAKGVPLILFGFLW